MKDEPIGFSIKAWKALDQLSSAATDLRKLADADLATQLLIHGDDAEIELANEIEAKAAIPGLADLARLGLQILVSMIENCISKWDNAEQVRESAANGDASAQAMVRRANARAARRDRREQKRMRRKMTREEKGRWDAATVSTVQEHPEVVDGIALLAGVIPLTDIGDDDDFE